MLPKGPAKKVTIYINEDTRHRMEPLWSAVFQFLLHKHAAGATVSRPMMGFGGHQAARNPQSEYGAEHSPMRIEFVDTAERVDDLLPSLYDMVEDGLIEVQDTTIVKSAQKGKSVQRESLHTRLESRAKLMRIYFGEADTWQGEPLHEAIVKRFRMLEVAGATVYRGILGYGAKGRDHKDGFMHLSRDAPIMISVVDTPERIEQAIAAVEPMMQDGLIVISDVDAVRLVSRPLTQEPSNAGATGT